MKTESPMLPFNGTLNPTRSIKPSNQPWSGCLLCAAGDHCPNIQHNSCFVLRHMVKIHVVMAVFRATVASNGSPYATIALSCLQHWCTVAKRLPGYAVLDKGCFSLMTYGTFGRGHFVTELCENVS